MGLITRKEDNTLFETSRDSYVLPHTSNYSIEQFPVVTPEN